MTQRTDECLLPSEAKNEEAGEQSEGWESGKKEGEVRWGLDMTAVSRACVYRSAAVYWGARAERTPAELSEHTQQHAHTQGRHHGGALRGADPNMRDPWAEQNGTNVLIGSWGEASLVGGHWGWWGGCWRSIFNHRLHYLLMSQCLVRPGVLFNIWCQHCSLGIFPILFYSSPHTLHNLHRCVCVEGGNIAIGECVQTQHPPFILYSLPTGMLNKRTRLSLTFF